MFLLKAPGLRKVGRDVSSVHHWMHNHEHSVRRCYKVDWPGLIFSCRYSCVYPTERAVLTAPETKRLSQPNQSFCPLRKAATVICVSSWYILRAQWQPSVQFSDIPENLRTIAFRAKFCRERPYPVEGFESLRDTTEKLVSRYLRGNSTISIHRRYSRLCSSRLLFGEFIDLSFRSLACTSSFYE